MSTVNPFDLLGGDDNDDPSHLIAAAHQKKVAAAAASAGGGKKSPAAAAPAAAAKMPTKPVPPSRAMREARNATNAPSQGGVGGGGLGRGRGRGGPGRGQNRDFGNMDENSFAGGYGGANSGNIVDGDGGKPLERSRGVYSPPRQSFRGGRRGGYGNVDGEVGGDSERHPRRVYERRSGTGRGYEMKREGAGRANWGTVNDDVIAQEIEENADENVAPLEQQLEQEDGKPLVGDKDNKVNAANEEMKPDDKEMTLDEYEKIKEEKRKALLAMKAEERKVTFDKELESMMQLSMKKENEEIFIKLGSDKESKKKDAEGEARAKKSLSINEFLKPAEGERYYGRSRGRGRGDRGRGGGGGFGVGARGGGGATGSLPAPAIEDAGQFPTLGGK